MASLYLKRCCGIVTVKTGAFFIALFNQAIAILGFVGYLSTIFIMSRHLSTPQIDKEDIFILVMSAFGILFTSAHIVMGSILIRGLQKERSDHLLWYLKIGTGVIALNFILIGCAAIFVYWLTVIPAGLGIVAQTYFLLVIRSAHKEMLEEEKTSTAVRCNMGSR